MANVLVFGFGAVGAIYGLVLHRAGCSVTAVCRSNYNHVSTKGMTIRSAIFGHETYHPRAVRTIQEAAEADPSKGDSRIPQYEYIIVASKALPGTASKIQEAVTPGHTAIVLAQNGIGIEEDYAQLYPSNPIISGVVYLPCTQVSPGTIEHGPLQHFEVGTYPSQSTPEAQTALNNFSNLFTRGGASAPTHMDVQPERWKKVAINAAWNPLSALTLCDDANLLRSTALSLPLIKTIMTEVGAVATAAGYPNLITADFIDEDLRRPQKRMETGGKEPSMLVDVKMGRRIEIEAIVGNVVRLADRFGVEVPTSKVVYAMAQARDFELRREEEGSMWKEIARH